MTPFTSKNVESLFLSYEENCRNRLMEIREIIFDISKKNKIIGELSEEIRWGQATYITKETKSGSSVRLRIFGNNKIAIFFHCKTILVSRFRALYSNKLAFSKNRAIILDPKQELEVDTISHCIFMSLTYNLNKKNKIFH